MSLPRVWLTAMFKTGNTQFPPSHIPWL
jgi:hypothetical protein